MVDISVYVCSPRDFRNYTAHRSKADVLKLVYWSCDDGITRDVDNTSVSEQAYTILYR